MSDFIWVEKYRPKTIEECILPDNTKKTFQSFLDKGEIPNMLLAGPPGIGKTTVAKALCNELGVDCYVINGSDEGRFLDTVRNNAKNFASTVSLSSTAKHKVIIIDEADNTSNDVQLLLRAFIGSLLATADSSSPVITKIKSLNPFIPDVPSSSLESKEKIVKPLPPSSSNVSRKSWMQKVLNMITRSW